MANASGILTPEIESIIQTGGSDWRQIATALVDHLTSEGRCFSSGEIAALIRTVDDKIPFSVTRLGEYLRDQFFSGQMPQYVDPATGARQVPVQYVPRTTSGTGRTPAGMEVFVYAPDPTLGASHDFEVDIPAPPGAGAGPQAGGLSAPPGSLAASGGLTDGSQPATSPALPAASTKSGRQYPVQITGNPKTDTHTAVVQNDGRCRVGRHAFEALVHAAGKPLVGGAPVYLSFQGDTAVVTLDQDPNVASVEYSLTTWNGDIRFGSPNGRFAAGTEYPVRITATQLVVEIGKPLS